MGTLIQENLAKIIGPFGGEVWALADYIEGRVATPVTAAQIAAPTAAMLADLNVVYRLNVAPYTRYYSNGTSLSAFAADNSGANRVPLVNALNSAGIKLTAAASAGQFAVKNTLGTSLSLLSEAANNSTITDTVMWEFTLGGTWDATKPLILTVNCGYTLGTGVLGTNTLTAHAYTIGGAGGYGADVLAGVAAQPLPAVTGLVVFTAVGNQAAGARVVISLALVLQDTAGQNITGSITSVRVDQ